MEICFEQRRKLELVARHRKSGIVELRDFGEGKFIAVIRKD